MPEFRPFGPFEIPRDGDLIDNSKEGLRKFWDRANHSAEELGLLSKAHGCYIFATRPKGGGLKPWYAGKATKTFKKEIFRNLSNYDRVINNKRYGVPVMFLLAQMTTQGKSFSKTAKEKDIDYVETFLIGLVLKKNSELINKQKAIMHEDLSIPGIMGSMKPGPRDSTVKDLQKLLGLDK